MPPPLLLEEPPPPPYADLMARRPTLWWFLAALGTLGVVLIVVFTAVHEFTAVTRGVAVAIGTALLVAAILGATIDQSLKKRLLQDAFETLFGYMLPEELKAELNWLSRQELVCDRFELTLTLREIEDRDLVVAHVELARDYRNVASHTVPFRPLLALDEWFHEGYPSRVLGLRVTHDDATPPPPRRQC